MKTLKKIFTLSVGILTISWSIGLPQLASALSVSSVSISTTSALINFDGPVYQEGSPSSSTERGSATNYANDLRNYVFKTGNSLTTRNLSRFDPYFMTTQSLGNSIKIYGLQSLQLQEGQAFQWQIASNTIRHLTEESTFVNAYNTTSTIAASIDPIIDNIINSTGGDVCNGWPCGNIGDTLTISGSNFATSTNETEISWSWTGGSATSTPATANATTLTAAIPSGANGQVNVNVKDLNNNYLSDIREVAVWDSGDQAIIVGNVSSTTSTDIDQVNVRAFQSGQMGNTLTTKTHNNGKYAIVSDSAATYNIEFTTPAGAAKAAPAKVSSQTTTIGSKTTVSQQSFQTAVMAGTIKGPVADGEPLMEGVEVVVHTMDWTTAQRSKTAADGSWKVYVPNSSSNQCYDVEAEPRDYHQKKLGYKSNKTNFCLTQDGTVADLVVYLTKANVTGILKTPVGDQSTSNPYPNTVVPYANIGLHTADWSYQQWTQTDSDGVFTFGGATAGSNYVLEIEPPMSGNFAGYARTMITSLTINGDGTTDLGIRRFSLSNVWGTATCANSASVGTWVELSRDGNFFSTSTDNEGKFRIGGVTAGNYTLRLQPPGGSSCSNTSQSITISSEEASLGKNLGTIALSEPNVFVTIKDPTGTTGQSQTWVNFGPSSGPGNGYGGSTNESGVVGLNVPDGSWRVEISPNWGSAYARPQEIIVNVSGSTITENTDVSNALTISGGNNLSINLLDPSISGIMGRVCKPGTSEDDCADLNQSVGVANVGVNLRVQNSMNGSQWSQTSGNGTYVFGGVDAGTYEIEAQPYSGCGEVSCARKSIIATITSSPSSRCNKNIVLASPNITGTVYKSAGDLTPVQNAWVSLETEGQMNGPGGFYGASTNSSGVFSFGGVSAGNYRLKIEPPTWGEEAANYRQYSTGQYSGINVSAAVANGSSNLDLGNRYLGVPQVVGRLMNPGTDGIGGNDDDQAVAWSYIMIHNETWQVQGGANTDQQGYFRIGGLPSDTTDLQIQINLGWGGNNAYIQPSGLTVDIANNTGTVKLNDSPLADNLITLTTPTKTLTGNVAKENSGGVVANARIQANKAMGGGFFETTTNSSGNYTLKLAGGTWWISVMPDWSSSNPDWVYNSPPTQITFVDSSSVESQTKNFEVQIANATITGLVKDPAGTTAMANAWVQANSGGMMGPGSGGNTDSSGRFTFKVPAGVYELIANPQWSGQGDSYAASTPLKVKAIADQTTDAGTLTFKNKNSSIKGTITDSAGNPVGNVMVNAWQMNGPGWANSMSNANTGRYELKVSEGTWGVTIMPMSTSYVYQGAPSQITVTSNQTSDNNDFLLKVADCKLKVSIKDQSGNRITNIWGGVSVRDTSLNDFMDFGDPTMMKDMSSTGGAMGPGMQAGGFGGGSLVNGYTEINVPTGTYELGLYSPPGSQYTLSGTESVSVSSSSTCEDSTASCEEVNLTVLENNATISGKAYLDTNNDGSYTSGTDTVVTGIRLFINGRKSGGGWSMTEFAPTSSSDTYSLRVAPGSWDIDAFIDPMMTFGSDKYKVVAENLSITATANSATTYNIALKKLDKTISGTVTDPDGVALSNVWVFVDYGDSTTANQMNDRGGLGVGTFTAADGTYTLNVASGTFKVSAGIPPFDPRDLINPAPQTITISDTNQTNINFQFSESDATITGDVTFSDTKNKAMVQAWSDNAGTGTFTESGTYSLKVKSGSTWYIKAMSNINGTLYESSTEEINVSVGANSKNLVLATTNISVPEAKTTTFNSSSDKTIELTNGLKLEIPAGALASTGTVTVTITPTVDVESTTIKADSKDKAIGLSYEFVAKNSSGQEITSFNQDVSITFPYDPTLITSAGYAETDVMPKYFDDTTNTWEKYKNTTQDTVNNTITVITDHFSSGGITGGGITSGSNNNNNGNEVLGGGGGGGATETKGPTNLSLKINQGITTTSSTKVTLSIKADNAAKMIISNNSDFSDVSWETYQTSKTWTLTSGFGQKIVYARFKDDKDNVSTTISATIKYQSSDTTIITEIISPQPAAAQTGEVIATPVVYQFKVNLRLGNQGNEVKKLQIKLKELGYLTIEATGYFGSLTLKAVQAFQSANKLPVTGYFGPMSREILNKLSVNKIETTPAPAVETPTTIIKFQVNLRYGAKSNEVKKLQVKLKELGYLAADVEATGYFGSLTLTAVKGLQKAKNLPVTGYFGPLTRAELNK